MPPLQQRVLSSLLGAIVAALAGLLVQRFVLPLLPDGATPAAAAAPPDLVAAPPTETWADVVGLADVKAELRRGVLLLLLRPDLALRGPLRQPKGTLLAGPPGTGKTMLVRALARESGRPLLVLTAEGLESKWWGESNKILGAAFRTATQLQPALLFFDEIDGLGGRRRADDDQACVYTLKTELLRHLDANERDAAAAVAVVACTNCEASLDPALRRRLPRVLRCAPPAAKARDSLLRKLGVADRALRAAIVAATEGKTAADLKAMHARANAQRLDAATVDALLAGKAAAAAVAPLTAAHWGLS